MLYLTKKEILGELKKLGINSTAELNSRLREYKVYYKSQKKSTILPPRICKNRRYVKEKRTHKRIPVSVEIRFYCWNNFSWKKLYTGKITNLSEKGMYMRTRNTCFPRDSQLGIFIPFHEEVMYIPAYLSSIVWRSLLPDDSFDGIGVKLSNPPRGYLAFVESLKATI